RARPRTDGQGNHPVLQMRNVHPMRFLLPHLPRYLYCEGAKGVYGKTRLLQGMRCLCRNVSAPRDRDGRCRMRQLLAGNYAVAEAVRLSRVQLVAAYPITPQTPIYEKLSDLENEGKLNGIMMRTESEHSAMAACISASLTGVRTFTATASQGLALMHEMLHFASGNRVPIVMCNVNRVVSAPWAFGSDQSDTLSQRDTGWMQFYCEDAQEAFDTVIQAYRISEEVLFPIIVAIDGFFTSHFIEPIEIPDQQAIDAFLPPFTIPTRFNIEDPAYVTNVVNGEQYMGYRKRSFDDMEKARPVIDRVNKEYQEAFGRGYGVIE